MVVILAVITMNAILGTVQTIKAEASLDSLKQMSAPTAKVVRDGKTIQIPGRDVVPGDIVVLEAGDAVCADGRLLESASLKTAESALTGESLPVEKEETPSRPRTSPWATGRTWSSPAPSSPTAGAASWSPARGWRRRWAKSPPS